MQHLAKMKTPAQTTPLNFDNKAPPSVIPMGAGKGEVSEKSLVMKFILDEFRAKLIIPFGVAAIREAVANKGSVCELQFQGDDKLVVERGAEVVEGDESESSDDYDEDDEDEESSDGDDDDEISLGSEDTDEKPNPKRQKV